MKLLQTAGQIKTRVRLLFKMRVKKMKDKSKMHVSKTAIKVTETVEDTIYKNYILLGWFTFNIKLL